MGQTVVRLLPFKDYLYHSISQSEWISYQSNSQFFWAEYPGLGRVGHTKIMQYNECQTVKLSAELRVFSRIFGHHWDQCKSGEKSEKLYGGHWGVYLRNYLTHRNGSRIKNCRISQGNVWDSFLHSIVIRNYYKFRVNVRLNQFFRGSLTSKLHVSDPRKHASQFFSLDCNLTFHSLGVVYNGYFFSENECVRTKCKRGPKSRISTHNGYYLIWNEGVEQMPWRMSD